MMTRLIIKSLIYGFSVGVLFIVIAPLGLGIGFIELLKPVLAPGALVPGSIMFYGGGPISWIITLAANGLIYSVLFLCIFSIWHTTKDTNAKRILTAVTICIFIIVCFGAYRYVGTQQILAMPSDLDSVAPISEYQDDAVTQRRKAIEAAYPEYRDFENQESFAGQSVKTAVHGDNYYFAYIVHGSGLQIVQVNCYMVDSAMNVSEVVAIPSADLSGLPDYDNFNPVTCSS